MSNSGPRFNGRLLDVRRDSADFRDRIYQPTLLPLRTRMLPDPTRMLLLHQGTEGACTGFGLAAMINYLNQEQSVHEPVSPRMLYEMAKRHDRWPGEAYDGSSARGAMKGWHKNGVCPASVWPYEVNRPGFLTPQARLAALRFPLGAYYRVLKKRSDMHGALTETGAIFATGAVHEGWDQVEQGVIPYDDHAVSSGGHAFCILGYTDDGFIIQNSWGSEWGGLTVLDEGEERYYPGLAIWTYADFERNFWDAWVARMALPVRSLDALATGSIVQRPGVPQRVQRAPRQDEIADYYIHIDDGQFDPKGDYPSSLEETQSLIQRAVDATAGKGRNKRPGHILLYAHGGLNTMKGSAARVRTWRDVFLDNRIHQIHFIWETGLLASLKDLIFGKDEFARERAGAFGDWKDGMLERLTQGAGYALWREMSEDAALAFQRKSAAGSKSIVILLEALGALPEAKRPKLHLIGHSAGAIWLGHLLKRWTRKDGLPIETLQLFAPACTLDFYASHIRTSLGNDGVRRATHYYLDDERERKDTVAGLYGKSLLYLVSRAFQDKHDIIPLMGMEKYWKTADQSGFDSFNTKEHPQQTRSDSHGGFDNDIVTMNHALALILNGEIEREFKPGDLKGY